MSDAKRKAAIAEFMLKQDVGVTLLDVQALSSPGPSFTREMLLIKTVRSVEGKPVAQTHCVFIDK